MHTKGSPQIETVSIFRTHLRWYICTSTRSCTCWWYLPVNGLLGIAELIAAVVVVVVAILVVLSTRDNRNCCGRGQAWGRDGGGGIVDSLQWNTYRIRLESIYRKNECASRVTWRFLPLFAVISARDEVGNQFGQRRSQYWTDLLGSHRLQVDRSGTLDQYTILIFSVPALPAISCCDSSCGELISSRRIRVDTDLSLGFRSVRNAARPLPLPAVW